VGLREQINENPRVTVGVIGAVVALLILFAYWEFAGGHPRAVGPPKQYYSSDDGKTWFSDDPDKVTPFDHGGALAVSCFIFKCPGSEPFAGYLQTFDRQTHDALLNPAGTPPGTSYSGILVKKPGDKVWVPINTTKGQGITNVQCPDGSGDKPVPVLP
jgi:hypothetical protein